jgi:deazaflavin-dependent oxidoreductase (nitroreductase family)
MAVDSRARAALRSAEIGFFRALNRFVEPGVRAGIGSPRIVPSGFIVLETRGRKSGRLIRTPLAATRIQGHVLIGTFRGARSQWLRNLVATPATRYWLAGSPRAARAHVMQPGRRMRVPKSFPAAVRWWVRCVAPYTQAGWAFAVLAPAKSGARAR